MYYCRVEPFASIYLWALGLGQHLTLHAGLASLHRPVLKACPDMAIDGSILNEEELHPPLFSYLGMLFIYGCTVVCECGGVLRCCRILAGKSLFVFLANTHTQTHTNAHKHTHNLYNLYLSPSLSRNILYCILYCNSYVLYRYLQEDPTRVP